MPAPNKCLFKDCCHHLDGEICVKVNDDLKKYMRANNHITNENSVLAVYKLCPYHWAMLQIKRFGKEIIYKNKSFTRRF